MSRLFWGKIALDVRDSKVNWKEAAQTAIRRCVCGPSATGDRIAFQPRYTMKMATSTTQDRQGGHHDDCAAERDGHQA
jgi:hypothetical protein